MLLLYFFSRQLISFDKAVWGRDWPKTPSGLVPSTKIVVVQLAFVAISKSGGSVVAR